jgi:ABC-type uncharacterized transport system substrate-binding protein
MNNRKSAPPLRQRGQLKRSWPSTRLLVTLGLTFAILWTALSASAQTPEKIPHIGYLWVGSEGSDSATRPGLERGLRELGYHEDRDIMFEYRYADGIVDRLGELVSDTVAGRPEIIVAVGTILAGAVKRATTTIPVVMGTGDPVGSGLVASLARPGGNITGVSAMIPEFGGKWLELLRELVPRTARVAVLWNPSNAASRDLLQAMRDAANGFGISLLSHQIRRSADFPIAFNAIAEQNPDTLIIDTDALVSAHRKSIIDFAAVRWLPAMYGLREFVDDGGLISYGASIFDLWRRGVAGQVDKILKGAKPADLPVEQPTKFELVINIGTARTLGLRIPPALLARADEVIE